VTLSTPAYDLRAWRERIPLLSSVVPMNNCSQAPQTDFTRAAAERYLESWNHAGMDWDEWMDEVRRAKQAFAHLVNASPDDVAVFSSVSEATSAVASAIEAGGDRSEIIVTDAEFPTIGHVWLAQEKRGLRVRWVPVRDGTISLDDYAVREQTALVSATHAYYMNGFMQDIGALVKRVHHAGALIYVDAYQSLGTVPVDVQALDVDFLAAGNLKFLMGVPGIAFLYVKRSVADRLAPVLTGWFGRSNPFAFDARRLDWSPGAARFDTGTPPVINAYVARAGMEMINEVGPANIRAWLEVLGQRLIDGGRERGFTLHGTDDMSRKTATTAFVVDDSHAVEIAMKRAGVIPSARGPVIRLAPHFYNTTGDVDVALDVLTAVLARA
jgi:selenocysteine lyase/cysteine desulfurase